MPPAASKPTTREAILDAAEAVVSEDGAGRLTIDAVVARSGFSKGGVLYHFPNKTALLEAMVGRLLAGVAGNIETAETRAAEAGDPLMPHVVTALCNKPHLDSGVPFALLAASAEQPELLDPAREFNRGIWHKLVDTAPDPVMAAIIMLALDGLSFHDLLNFAVLDPQKRETIHQRLVSLSEEIHA